MWPAANVIDALPPTRRHFGDFGDFVLFHGEQTQIGGNASFFLLTKALSAFLFRELFNGPSRQNSLRASAGNAVTEHFTTVGRQATSFLPLCASWSS